MAELFAGAGARSEDQMRDTVMATRAGARLDLAVGADAAGLAALEALDEIERLLMRHGDNPEVRVLARDTALEAAAALDAGWDVEEEGWQETSAFDEESVALTQRVLGVIHLCVSFDPEANHDPTEDPTWTVATIWASFADPNGRGRSGRVAHERRVRENAAHTNLRGTRPGRGKRVIIKRQRRLESYFL